VRGEEERERKVRRQKNAICGVQFSNRSGEWMCVCVCMYVCMYVCIYVCVCKSGEILREQLLVVLEEEEVLPDQQSG
jgi:hypothetical protein